MTIEEMFPLIMIEFERLHARLDKLENQLKLKGVLEYTPEDWEQLGEFSKSHIHAGHDSTVTITSPDIKVIGDIEVKPLKELLEEAREEAITLFSVKDPDQQCFWVNMPPEDRMKPMGLSCPCKRCSPMSCTTELKWTTAQPGYGASWTGIIPHLPGEDKCN